MDVTELSERRLVEIETRMRGRSAPDHFRSLAIQHAQHGDIKSRDKFLIRASIAETYLADEHAEKVRQASLDPNSSDLFGGVANARLVPDFFDFGNGLCVRKTFVHVMAPFLLAFVKAKAGEPHPAPWKSAGGGFGFDVEIEIALPQTHKPTKFDRLNTIWWITALMRLHHPCGLRVPVISDTSFSAALMATVEPTFWPIEMSPRGQIFTGSQEIAEPTLDWIRDNYAQGAVLMGEPSFSIAFLALDAAHSANSRSSAKMLIWSAIEALFRPGKEQITKRLCAAVATYLHADPARRDREYQRVHDLYEARGQVAHAAETPEERDVVAAFVIAKSCFVRAIEDREQPNTMMLLERWRNRT